MADPKIQPARRHYTISASPNRLAPEPKSVYVSVAGSATFVDADDNAITWNVVAGAVLPFVPKAVTAITSATLIAIY